jgi:hypothetical protein
MRSEDSEETSTNEISLNYSASSIEICANLAFEEARNFQEKRKKPASIVHPGRHLEVGCG